MILRSQVCKFPDSFDEKLNVHTEPPLTRDSPSSRKVTDEAKLAYHSSLFNKGKQL